ncbi:hypothetical protein HY967_00140 [Candidatus Jorgensenbacteria bacterium]|nr:hypothetical protein [Candidatus Jorgensenbacteria bacterium]
MNLFTVYHGPKESCDYCKHRFEVGEEVWVSDDKVICRPDPHKACNATHVGDFRIGVWDCMIFRSVKSPSV